MSVSSNSREDPLYRRILARIAHGDDISVFGWNSDGDALVVELDDSLIVVHALDDRSFGQVLGTTKDLWLFWPLYRQNYPHPPPWWIPQTKEEDLAPRKNRRPPTPVKKKGPRMTNFLLTAKELVELRERRTFLVEGHKRLLGYDLPGLAEKMDATVKVIDSETYAIKIDCILCGTEGLMRVLPTGLGMPKTMICDTCDAKTTAAVLAEPQSPPGKKEPHNNA